VEKDGRIMRMYIVEVQGSHSGNYEELFLLDITPFNQFRKEILPLSSGSCLAYYSTLKMEAINSAET
jgi:hypothetical protein